MNTKSKENAKTISIRLLGVLLIGLSIWLFKYVILGNSAAFPLLVAVAVAIFALLVGGLVLIIKPKAAILTDIADGLVSLLSGVGPSR